MGQCCAKPATSVEKRAAPVEQRNDIKRNFSDRQRAWASTGTVALRDADLQELPEVLRTFAEPGRVRRLDATNNRLATLPHWLFHRFAGLQQLTLSHNRLTALPAELGLLTSLKVLVVDHNAIRSLPASLASLSKLERFNASYNQLTDVGALGALGNLKQLNLSHNRLTALPSSIGESTALQELDVSNNSLQALPEELGALTRLQLLSADDNQIAAVPSAIMKQCLSLTTLTLHANPVTLQVLQSTDGWVALEQRRRAKFSKSIQGGASAMMSRGMDQGVDR